MGRRQAMGGASKAVAIKLLATHLVSKPVYRRMFVDEARLTMMLTHSNIVQVFDVGEHEGRSYLVMEWIDGLDLSRLAASMREQGEAFELHVVAHLIGEVLRGLAYAHGLTEGDESSTIVHRDISPHNVLISVSGEVKVSDFGVARLASEETSGLHVRGKLRYMPPEQLRGESKHATTDLFAVGAMMQELLDGVRFRAGLGRDALFGMVVSGEVPPLLRADVPPELRALRDGLLARDPSARLQSADEALRLLRRWPGYRNAADELTSLVRGRAGVVAPRTGLTVEFSDEELEPSDEPTVLEASGSQNSSELATRTFVGADEAASETTPHPLEVLPAPVAVGARPVRPRLPALLLGLAAFGVSLGFGSAWFEGSAPAPSEYAEAPEIAPPEAAPPEPAEPAEPEPSPTVLANAAPSAPPPSPAEPAPARPASSDDDADADAHEQSSERRAPKATIPAEVEFAAHQFFFVWIKIDGQVKALEPVAKLSVSAGRHKVWLRERASDPWVLAGRIKLGSGQRYRVSLEQPAGLKLERLD